MSKILYANGCSMAEGSELGNKQFNYDESKYGACTDRFSLKTSGELEHMRWMEEHSWPYLLSKKLGYEQCVNSGAGGASNSKIVRTTIKDLLKLLETHDASDIHVAIGWTSFYRYEIFSDNTWWGVLPTLGKCDCPNKDIQKLTEIFNKWVASELEYVLTVNFMQMLQLKDFLESRSIKYVFSYGISDPFSRQFGFAELNDMVNHEHIKLLFSQLKMDKHWIFHDPRYDFNEVIDLETFLKFNQDKAFFNFCKMNNVAFGTGQHPLEDGHELWASFLADTIKQKGILA